MKFNLHPNLEKKLFITDLPLCKVLLEDEKHYPWLILVPTVSGVSKMMDLSFDQQVQLLKELDFVQKIVWENFSPKQINVAALGNKTPQLHIHVIARYENDPAWPNTVFDHPIRKSYGVMEKKSMVEKLKDILSTSLSKKLESE